ncbi:MAG: alpha/beta hydrolase [Bacillota bacterium]|nr:alpha/beta hydrolase [Bacillota bacterium]
MRSLVTVLMIVLRVSSLAAQQTTASADGTLIRYEVHGQGDPTFVLVHGFTNNRTWWEPHIQTLAGSHRVVTMDLAGFGESGRDRRYWTMEAHGQDVAAVVRAVDASNAVLVGFSMGGAAVIEAAKLVRPRVRGVVLVDIFNDPDFVFTPEVIADIRRSIARTWHNRDSLSTAFSPGAPDSLRQRYLDRTPPVWPDYWWTILEDFWRWNNASLVPSLKELGVPIEAINSQRQPTAVTTYRKYVPSFRVTTISEVGHLGMVWEKTAEFDRILNEIAARFRTPGDRTSANNASPAFAAFAAPETPARAADGVEKQAGRCEEM